MKPVSILAVLMLALGACESDTQPEFPQRGASTPTVAGGTATNFDDYAAAKRAFTRQSPDRTITATLEDSAWLRFEGDPETIMRDHRAYYEFGYTTFEVILATTDYVRRPTDEVFVLQDSAGATLTSKPLRYEGEMKLVADRWTFRFPISFQHVITGELDWIRLTRQADGATVEWRFGGGPGNVPITRE